MRKSSVLVIVILLLVVMLGAGAVGYLSKGFKNWDYKDWFKQEQKEQEQNPPDINVPPDIVPPDTDDTIPVEEVYAMSEHCIFSESLVSAFLNPPVDSNIVTDKSIEFKAESSDGQIVVDNPVYYVRWVNIEIKDSIEEYLLLEPYDSYVKVTLLKEFTNSINLYAVSSYSGVTTLVTTLDYVGSFGGYVGKPYINDSFVTENTVSDFEFIPYGDNYKVNGLACMPAVKTSLIKDDFTVSTELSINCDLKGDSFDGGTIFFSGNSIGSSSREVLMLDGLKSDFSIWGNFLKKYGLGTLNLSIDPEELYMSYFPLLDNLYRLRNNSDKPFFRYDINVSTQYFTYDYSIYVNLGELGYEPSYDINNPPTDVTYPIHENNPFWRLVHDFIPENKEAQV